MKIEYKIVNALRELLHAAELEGEEWDYISGLQAAYDTASQIADGFQ
jgi:hypothetical protein